MRRLVLLALLFLPIPLAAQTATPTSKFTIDQPAPDLATAQGYTFKLYADGATTGTVVLMTCAGASSPFTCTTPIGPFTPGAHSVAFTAGNLAGESAKSAPATFTMVLIPAVPLNPRVQ